MTVEQPTQQNLTSEDVQDTIKIIRLLNLILDNNKIPKEDKQKFFEGFHEMFKE